MEHKTGYPDACVPFCLTTGTWDVFCLFQPQPRVPGRVLSVQPNHGGTWTCSVCSARPRVSGRVLSVQPNHGYLDVFWSVQPNHGYPGRVLSVQPDHGYLDVFCLFSPTTGTWTCSVCSAQPRVPGRVLSVQPNHGYLDVFCSVQPNHGYLDVFCLFSPTTGTWTCSVCSAQPWVPCQFLYIYLVIIHANGPQSSPSFLDIFNSIQIYPLQVTFFS